MISGQNRHFVLVDPVAENLLKFKGPTTTLEISDGVEYQKPPVGAGYRGLSPGKTVGNEGQRAAGPGADSAEHRLPVSWRDHRP